MTVSPTSTPSELPNGSGTRLPSSILSTAMSVSGVRADEPRAAGPPVAELDLNLVHALDHMVVRDDVPFLADDGAGAELGLRPGAVLALVAMEKLEERVVLVVFHLNGPGSRDADDGRHDRLRQRDPLPAHGRQDVHVFEVDARPLGQRVLFGVAVDGFGVEEIAQAGASGGGANPRAVPSRAGANPPRCRAAPRRAES